MEQMQAKLNEYRKKKRRKEQLENFKTAFRKFIMLGTGIGEDRSVQINIQDTSQKKVMDDGSSVSSEENDSDLPNYCADACTSHQEDNKFLKNTLRIVYFLFWVTLFVIAIELKFGLIYLMFSALVGIYLNTRTGPKRRNEISAYSVFNRNCESIDGTLKAEHFEREIRFGAAGVK